MSKKIGGVPSYLRQIAQPIAPAEAVLTPRPGAATYAAETVPLVPVIEDHLNMPARTSSTRGSARAESERLAMNQEFPPPVSATIERPEGREPWSVAARRENVHRTDAGQHAPQVVSAIKNASAGDSPDAGKRKPRGRARREESSVVQSLRVEESRAVADLTKPEHVLLPRSSGQEESSVRHRSELGNAVRTESKSDSDTVVEKKAATDSLPSQSEQSGYIKERTVMEPASEAVTETRYSQQRGRPEVQADAGPRVHIGTVEIRMTLPQPPAPPPTVMAPSQAHSNETTQARGRSGPAESLARGLEWSYGLVQG